MDHLKLEGTLMFTLSQLELKKKDNVESVTPDVLTGMTKRNNNEVWA
jgi:hypothetical protein